LPFPAAGKYRSRFIFKDNMMDAVLIHNLSKAFTPTPRYSRRAGLLAAHHLGAARKDQPAESTSALRGISLSIRPGERFGILGAHGAGKTTLLRLVAALLRPDSGRVAVFGMDTVAQANTVRRLVNPLDLDSGLLDRLSPQENLVYAARLSGLQSSATCLDSLTLLVDLGLTAQQAQSPLISLPRSARRKTALARLIQSPARLLLLDNPLANLEIEDRRLAWDVLRRCVQQTGRTLIFATTEPVDVLAVSERAAVLDEGCLAALGAPADLIKADLNNAFGLQNQIQLQIT
jgi:ABC-type multidrug transport system ATPase subunit